MKRYLPLAISYVAERVMLYAAIIVPAILSASIAEIGQLELLLTTAVLAMGIGPFGLDESIKLNRFRSSFVGFGASAALGFVGGAAVGAIVVQLVPSIGSPRDVIIVAATASMARVFRERARVTPTLTPVAIASLLGLSAFAFTMFVLTAPLGAPVAAAAGVVVYYLVLSVAVLPAITRQSDHQPAKILDMLRFGLPLILVGLATWGIAAIDRFMLANMTDLSSVAEYGIAYRTTALLTGVAATGVVWWRSESFRLGEDWTSSRMIRVAVRGSALFGVAAVILGLPMAYVSAELTQTNLSFTAPLVALLLASGLLWLISMIVLMPATMAGQTRSVAVVWGVGFVINVVANLAFIPPFEVMGAAIATVLAFGGTAVGAIFVAKRHINTSPAS